MDSILADRLKKIRTQIDVLEDAERIYLELEVLEKAKYGFLFTQQEGGSVEEKKQRVINNWAYQETQKERITAEVRYNKEKRILDLFNNAYLAEHLSFKINAQAIKKGVE